MENELPSREPGATPLPPLDPEPYWPWNIHISGPPPLRHELTDEEADAITSILSGETAEQWRERQTPTG